MATFKVGDKVRLVRKTAPDAAQQLPPIMGHEGVVAKAPGFATSGGFQWDCLCSFSGHLVNIMFSELEPIKPVPAIAEILAMENLPNPPIRIPALVAGLLLTCLLTGCVTTPPSPSSHWYATGVVPYEDDDVLVIRKDGGLRPYAKGDITVNGVVETPKPFMPDAQMVTRTKAALVDPAFDPQEARAFWTMAGGYGLDLITTQIKLGQGCVEANPLAAGPPIVRILPPAFHLTMYYVMAKQTPFGQPFALKQTKGFGYFRGVVGLHNLTVHCQ